jgi:DNA-binding NtrC family response regulator
MNHCAAVLVVDDDPDVLHAARFALTDATTQVETVSSVQGLEEMLLTASLDAVLLDMNFGPGRNTGAEGLDALHRIQRIDPTLAVVMMTAYAGVALAVESLKSGAVDFVMKPWRNEALVACVSAARALTLRRREAERLELDEVERQTIKRALLRHEGNISLAAASLGLSRAALYRRKAKYEL